MKSHPRLPRIHSGFATDVHSYSLREEFYPPKNNVKHAEQGRRLYSLQSIFYNRRWGSAVAGAGLLVNGFTDVQTETRISVLSQGHPLLIVLESIFFLSPTSVITEHDLTMEQSLPPSHT